MIREGDKVMLREGVHENKFFKHGVVYVVGALQPWGAHQGYHVFPEAKASWKVECFELVETPW